MTYKVFCITGATAGFGTAIAHRAAAFGPVYLILIGRRTERLEALAKELPVPTLCLPLDVRNREAVTTALTTLPPDFAAVDDWRCTEEIQHEKLSKRWKTL